MVRAVALTVACLLVAGCVSGNAPHPSGSPSTGAVEPTTRPTVEPAPPDSPAPAPPDSPAPAPGAEGSPTDGSSTQASPSDCAPFPTDPAALAQPAVALNLARDPSAFGPIGLNGSAVLAGQPFPAGDWHQPDPLDAFVVDPGEELLVRAFLEWPTWLCLGWMTVDAAPFSPLGRAPDPGSLVRLADRRATGGKVTSFTFAAPTQAGEWVVPVRLTFLGASAAGAGTPGTVAGTAGSAFDTPAPTSQESFFRLRIGVPEPTVEGTASTPLPCRRPGSQPPRALLSVDGGLAAGGGQAVAGDVGSVVWNGTSADVGGEPTGPQVTVPGGGRVTIAIEGDVCAGWWRVVLAPRPPASESAPILEPFLDLVPRHLPRSGVAPGEANRFALAPVPPGDWVIRAELGFADGLGASLGSTNTYWHVLAR